MKKFRSDCGRNLLRQTDAWNLLTAQKMKFSIKDFFSKCDQIRSLLRIWSLLLKKSLMEYFIFCAVAGHRFVLIKDTHRENAPSNKS